MVIVSIGDKKHPCIESPKALTVISRSSTSILRLGTMRTRFFLEILPVRCWYGRLFATYSLNPSESATITPIIRFKKSKKRVRFSLQQTSSNSFSLNEERLEITKWVNFRSVIHVSQIYSTFYAFGIKGKYKIH